MNASLAGDIPPVRKTLTVKVAPDRAFQRFTAGMASWWPLRSHSVGQDQAETVEMEGRVGGRIVERLRGGRECTWGTITAWDPPRRVAFTWHPGREPESAQDVEVRFTPVPGGTQVVLEHRGFERLGALARKARGGYNIGWVYVFGLYGRRRGLVMALLGGLTNLMVALQRRRSGRST